MKRKRSSKPVSSREKLEREHPSHGKVVAIPPAMRKNLGQGTLLIPRPLDIDARVRKIRQGGFATIGGIRRELAHKAGADFSCPFTSGIFLRLVAEAAEEDRRAGKQRIAPYWRVVREDGRLVDKFPGGVAAQAKKLRAEGFEIAKGRMIHPRFA